MNAEGEAAAIVCICMDLVTLRMQWGGGHRQRVRGERGRGKRARQADEEASGEGDKRQEIGQEKRRRGARVMTSAEQSRAKQNRTETWHAPGGIARYRGGG